MLGLSVEDAFTGVVIQMEEHVLGEMSVSWPKLTVAIAVRPAAEIGLAHAKQSSAPGTGRVACCDDQTEMIEGFWWQLPAAIRHRVLAIHFYACDPVVGGAAVLEVELPVQVDLDQRAHVGLFGLVQLVVCPPSGVLAVVQLVKSIPKDGRDLVTRW